MQDTLLRWYDATARDLPWRRTKDPYAIWVSEIMLQQTRAETVVGYWTRFMRQYPTVQALAAAPEEDVLKAWEGLGYYSRARNLRRCAQAVVDAHGGAFPQTVEALRALPGIGDYTAGAVASIAFGVRTPAVDGNVERVVSRLRGIREDVGIPSVRRRLWAEAAALVPEGRPGDFNQAMMELGARICQPVLRCDDCPVQAWCDAYEAGDADALPVKQRKAAPKEIERAIALVFDGDKVLLRRREERLLHGMWEFPGFDCLDNGMDVENDLQIQGVNATFVEEVGRTKHVFTHMIWRMSLMRFAARTPACPEGWQWADTQALAALPIPTALKAARAEAMAYMQYHEKNKPLALDSEK